MIALAPLCAWRSRAMRVTQIGARHWPEPCPARPSAAAQFARKFLHFGIAQGQPVICLSARSRHGALDRRRAGSCPAGCLPTPRGKIPRIARGSRTARQENPHRARPRCRLCRACNTYAPVCPKTICAAARAECGPAGSNWCHFAAGNFLSTAWICAPRVGDITVSLRMRNPAPCRCLNRAERLLPGKLE